MKKVLLSLAVALFAVHVNAQFTSANLQATGLTCAMCSNAINKALQAVPFVESVKSDIKNSSFNIIFKKDQEPEIDAIKQAVEDAGFSVGSLKLTGRFSGLKIGNGQHVKIGKSNFHFLETKEPVLDGEKTITVVDKNFISAKQFRKYSSMTKLDCVQTGKAASCCTKEGITPETRIYHVII